MFTMRSLARTLGVAAPVDYQSGETHRCNAACHTEAWADRTVVVHAILYYAPRHHTMGMVLGTLRAMAKHAARTTLILGVTPATEAPPYSATGVARKLRALCLPEDGDLSPLDDSRVAYVVRFTMEGLELCHS